MFGVAGVGACLLQVIHADKCVLPGNSHQENQEWPAKVLGLESYGQDKFVESAQTTVVCKCGKYINRMQCSGARNSTGNQGLWAPKG